MTMSTAMENSILLLLFNNDDFLLIGDAGGLLQSVADGVFFISLHTADPGEGGTQDSNEATYGSYARQSVARTTGGFTVVTDNVSNAAEVAFPEASSGSETLTHFAIGVAVSGATLMLMSSILDTSRAVSSGITPRFAIGELDVDAE